MPSLRDRLSLLLPANRRLAEAWASAAEPSPVALAPFTRGDAPASDAALQRLIDEYGPAVSFQIAAAHAWRGEVDAAFDWLERAYRERDPGLGESVAYPLLRALHVDPRWPALMRKKGFE